MPFSTETKLKVEASLVLTIGMVATLALVYSRFADDNTALAVACGAMLLLSAPVTAAIVDYTALSKEGKSIYLDGFDADAKARATLNIQEEDNKAYYYNGKKAALVSTGIFSAGDVGLHAAVALIAIGSSLDPVELGMILAASVISMAVGLAIFQSQLSIQTVADHDSSLPSNTASFNYKQCLPCGQRMGYQSV